MKKVFFLFAAALSVVSLSVESSSAQGNRDWADYGRYAEANANFAARVKAGEAARPDAVFMGNSITDFWATRHADFFAEGNYVGRGISGQVTAQMLARFRSDVLDLQPKAVVILAGTNDIALNMGYVSVEHIAGNIFSMAELAKAHKIKVIICSVLPAAKYPWRPEVEDVPSKVREVNTMLKAWAAENDCTYLDYFSAMEDGKGGLPKALAEDGIHPTAEGYARMQELVKPVLDKILKRR